MKLVIDIDEETYNGIKHGMRNRDDVENIMEQIENGTPLPKGHGRLIDADKLCSSLEPSDFDDEPWDNVDNACRIIYSMPVENVIPMSVFEDIKAEIDAKLKEPEYMHDGEDWQSGLIMAETIIDKYVNERDKDEADN